MLRLLNNDKMFYESRAGRVIREFNSILRLSTPAQALYLLLSGFMGVDRKRKRDECRVGIDKIAEWTDRSTRAVQDTIRESTLTGPLPLIEKREPGVLGRPTLYSFVCDPFALAASQFAESPSQAGSRNVATRPRVEVTGTAIDPRPTPRCLTGKQIEFLSDYDGFDHPYGDDAETREYYALCAHLNKCQICHRRLAEANGEASALDVCA